LAEKENAMLKVLLAATLLCAGSLALAQTAPAPASPARAEKGRRFDCSQTKDPQACEARRQKMLEARDKARAACEGKKGEDHANCMEQQLCPQAKDPAKCEARVKERIERRKSQQPNKAPQ
jgi:hypothetical protein